VVDLGGHDWGGLAAVAVVLGQQWWCARSSPELAMSWAELGTRLRQRRRK
jgi:hypothetical protein